MTLQIPNHTIKAVVQNSKPKFSSKAIINSPQILQVSSKTVAKQFVKKIIASLAFNGFTK